MSYAELIHDVKLLTGGSPTRQTPDYYASLAKQYADRALKYSKDSEAFALSSEESSNSSKEAYKEITIMRDACKKFYENTKAIADSIEEMQISIITDEDIDIVMESNTYGKQISHI